jgi:hypothetical protein
VAGIGHDGEPRARQSLLMTLAVADRVHHFHRHVERS